MKYLGVLLVIALLVVVCLVVRKLRQPKVRASVNKIDARPRTTQQFVVLPNHNVLQSEVLRAPARPAPRGGSNATPRRDASYDDTALRLSLFDDGPRGGNDRNECAPTTNHVSAQGDSGSSAPSYDSSPSTDAGGSVGGCD